MQNEQQKGYKILVFEDDPAYRSSYISALEQRGFDVKALDSAENFTNDEIKTLAPDVISYDVMMPGITGFEAAERALQDPELSRIPFVFVTSTTGQKERAKGQQLGCMGYFEKYETPIPTIVSELERIIAHSPRH